MVAPLQEIERLALQLSPRERGELIHRLIVSLEAPSAESPEAVTQAWDAEIARRVAAMQSGDTPWIPAAEVFQRLDTLIEHAR